MELLNFVKLPMLRCTVPKENSVLEKSDLRSR